MKRSWIGLSLLIVVAGLASGCGNPCEGARDRFDKRYEECGFNVAPDPESGDDASSGELVCSDADAVYLDCLADCAESATCEAISGEDTEGNIDFGECTGACAN